MFDLAKFIFNKGHAKQLEYISKLAWIPNAMIFVGPEGIGKKLVAKHYFCKMNANHEYAVTAMNKGEYDSFHVWAPEEGKKTITVDQAREIVILSESQPHPFKYHLFVIDQAEKLTQEAASALLKTLEEPPFDRTRFVLLTPDVSRLLPTIRSRAHIVQFFPLSVQEVTDVLQEQHIGNAEQLAAISGGSVSRAIELTTEKTRSVRSGLLSFFLAGPSLVVYSAFQFVDKLESEDWPVVSQILETLLVDLVSMKAVGMVRYNKDFEAELTKRVLQNTALIEALIQDISDYLVYAERGLNHKLQLKNLLLSSLFYSKGQRIK